MAWDPAVLRKYNTTGHFRLLNQVRSELKGNPLIRPKAGETVGAANRSRSLTRALESRAQSGGTRSRRSPNAVDVVLAPPELRSLLTGAAEMDQPSLPGLDSSDAEGLNGGFRNRLSAIDVR